MLLLADNTSGLRLHKVLACKTACRLNCAAVEHLSLGTNLACLCHFYIIRADFVLAAPSRNMQFGWNTYTLLIVGILVVAVVSLVCRRALMPNTHTSPDAMSHPEEHMLELGSPIDPPYMGPHKGNFTWIMHSYASTVKAGAELMAHEISKYLQRNGWTVNVLLYDCHSDEYDGVPLIRMPYQQPLDERCKEIMSKTDVIGCQNLQADEGIKIAEDFGLPICFFLHLDIEKIDVLQQRWSAPVFVVYNAMTQHEIVPTIHPWTVVRPHIDYKKFEALNTSKGEHITLLNCIPNKGGHTIKALAEMMPEHKFIGVRGGYGPQVIDGQTDNITYYAHTDNPLPFYENSRVIIMPSKSESWGRVALEAMAAGIPVIVGDTPGLRECTNSAAPICMQEDVGCWEREVRRLYADGPDREAAIQAGYRRIAELKAAKDYENFEKFLLETAIPAKKGRAADTV